MREAIIEEPPSWRGHSFTLLVFGGIVVLCTIFFVLGMLVGRTQGQRIAEAGAAESGESLVAQEVPAGQELTFYTPIDEEIEPPVPAFELPPEPVAEVVPEPPARGRIFLQIAALSQQKEAEKQLNNVKSKGFRGLIISPAAGGPDRLYRVQVGPYETEQDAQKAKKDLEAKGFKQVFMKR